MDGHLPVAVDGVDDPVVTVADRQAAVGVEAAVVAPGDDLVTGAKVAGTDLEPTALGAQLARYAESLGLVVQSVFR